MVETFNKNVQPLTCGRFAPSPSGPLHFGSLIAAVGSYLIAKSSGAKWLVRIEDIDPPREVPGASDLILHQLEAFALEWDGEVLYQSTRIDQYQTILEKLKKQDLLYACNCTRKVIHNKSEHGLYPNLCANKNLPFKSDTAIRIRHGNDEQSFHDRIQGKCQFASSLYQEDFIVKRKDGLIAYQLAVVIDDIEQGIDHIVRGYDLLDSTPRQLRLYQLLSAKPPQFYHLPLAVTKDGNKLSKQNHAESIDTHRVREQLLQALDFLGQIVPQDLKQQKPATIIQWAVNHFELAKIPNSHQIQYFAD